MDAITSGGLAGNGILPLSFAEDSHAAYLGVGITTVDKGVQNYVGPTYAVEGGSVVSVEPEPVAVAKEGIPGS
jgi:hypothetical protein